MDRSCLVNSCKLRRFQFDNAYGFTFGVGRHLGKMRVYSLTTSSTSALTSMPVSLPDVPNDGSTMNLHQFIVNNCLEPTKSYTRVDDFGYTCFSKFGVCLRNLPLLFPEVWSVCAVKDKQSYILPTEKAAVEFASWWKKAVIHTFSVTLPSQGITTRLWSSPVSS